MLIRYSSGFHGDANKSSAPPWADEPIEKRCVHVFHRAHHLPPEYSTTALSQSACTDTHSTEEEEKEEEEEVPEGGERGVLVWFLFKLLLQYRLFFHWLLRGPAGFRVVRNRARLLNVNTKGGHGTDCFCLLLRLALRPHGAILYQGATCLRQTLETRPVFTLDLYDSL